MRLLRPVEVPGLPRVPGMLALAALRFPRLVPVRLRWHAATRGTGFLVSRLLQSGDDAGAVLRAVGEEQGRAIADQLGYGRDPHEVARVVAMANRLYDIRARVHARSPTESVVETPGCPWSREPWWGAKPCACFSQYEVGLTAGLNPRVQLRYESKRTRGDDRCVGVYSWRPRA